MTSSPNSDKPLGIEQLGSDNFNRSKFAERIAQTLLSRQGTDGLTVSVEGEWGSGKSSVLTMIKKYLSFSSDSIRPRHKSKASISDGLKGIFDRARRSTNVNGEQDLAPVIVEFNPWISGASDKIIQAIMTQIASRVGLDAGGRLASMVSRQMISYASLLEPLKWIPGAEPWASLSQKSLSGGGKTLGGLAKKLRELDIANKKEALRNGLIHLGKRIIILVDDIDRLPPGEVFQTIRAIQAVADLPCCSFVIAIDSEYVETALSIHAKLENPGQYLDKIIQLRLALPLISGNQLEHFFESRLMEALNDQQKIRYENNKERFVLIWHVAIKPLLKTPRDAIRIVNRFIHTELSCGEEVCWGDLIGLQVLAILFPFVYKHISTNPAAYTGVEIDPGHPSLNGEDSISAFASDRQKTLERLDSKTRSSLTRLIEELFPMTRSYSYDKLSQTDYSRQRRVACSNRLRIALSYDLPSDEISQREVISFLTNPSDRAFILDRVKERNLVNRLMERLLQEASGCIIPEPIGVIGLLGLIIEEQRLSSSSQGFYSILRMSTLDMIVKTAEEILLVAREEDQSLLEKIVSQADILSLSAHLVAKHIRRVRKERERDMPGDDYPISVDQDISLTKWLDTCRCVFGNHGFASAADQWMVVRTLLSIAEGRDILPSLMNPYLESVELFEQVLDVFIGSFSSTPDEDLIGCSERYLGLLGNINNIRALARQSLERLEHNASPRSEAILNCILSQGRYNLRTGLRVVGDDFDREPDIML